MNVKQKDLTLTGLNHEGVNHVWVKKVKKKNSFNSSYSYYIQKILCWSVFCFYFYRHHVKKMSGVS